MSPLGRAGCCQGWLQGGGGGGGVNWGVLASVSTREGGVAAGEKGRGQLGGLHPGGGVNWRVCILAGGVNWGVSV